MFAKKVPKCGSRVGISILEILNSSLWVIMVDIAIRTEVSFHRLCTPPTLKVLKSCHGAEQAQEVSRR